VVYAFNYDERNTKDNKCSNENISISTEEFLSISNYMATKSMNKN